MKKTFDILIVDDKELDRSGICFLIRQNNLMLTTDTAASGAEAISVLGNKKFDILLTDIKMPEMSGLELISHAKKLQPQLKCVVFSSYDNFEYAQTAIDVGVSKYLLKPIKIDDFLSCFNSLIAELNEEQSEKKAHHYYDMLTDPDNQSDNTAKISKYLFLMDFILPFFNQSNAESLLPHIPEGIIRVPLNEYQCLFVSDTESTAKGYISSLCNHLHSCENRFLITYGGYCKDISEMRALFNEVEQYTSAKFYISKSETVYLDELPEPESTPDIKHIWDTCHKIAKCVTRRETDNADALLDELFAILQINRKIPINIIKSACNEIASGCLLYEEGQQESFLEAVKKIEKSNNIEELKENISDIIHMHNAASRETLAIQKAIEIIHQNYAEDIGLESVAAQVYLSSCYFSYLFKKTTGVNFLKYLTTYRVERAKDLLRTTSLRIGEICERVGYSNRSYFCQIFRNHCGMSPVQYREMRP